MSFDPEKEDEKKSPSDPHKSRNSSGFESGDKEDSPPDDQSLEAAETEDEPGYMEKEVQFNFITQFEAWEIQKSKPATIVLFIINILLFFAMAVATKGQSFFIPDMLELHQWGASFGPLSLGSEAWRILTAMFLHIGVLHLFLNMFGLWVFGGMAERLFGTRSYVALYFLSGMAGSCFSLLLTPTVTAAGASGAIFGVMGAMAAFFHCKKDTLKDYQYKQGLRFMTILIVLTLVTGLFKNVDNGAHFGGMLVGFVGGLLLYPERKTPFLKPLSVLFLSFAIFGLFKLAQTAPLDFDGIYHFERGFMQAIYKNKKEALDYADSYIKKNPKKSIGYIRKARICHRIGEYETACKNYTKAIELEPNRPELYMQRANSYLNDGQLVLALQDCNKAESLGIKGYFLAHLRMMAMAQSGRYKEALKYCNKLLVMEGSDTKFVLTERAKIFELMGKNGEAMLDLNSVIEKDPDFIRAVERRAYMYYSQNRMKELNQEIKKAEAVTRLDDEFDYVSRAYASIAFDRYKQGIKDGITLVDNSESKKLNALYGALVGRAAAQFVKDEESSKLIDKFVKDSATKAWPYPVWRYLKSEISKDELMDIAGDSRNKLTELKTFLGLDSEVKNDPREARKYYKWVIENGNPFFLEWDLARVRLSKLDRIQPENNSSTQSGLNEESVSTDDKSNHSVSGTVITKPENSSEK